MTIAETLEFEDGYKVEIRYDEDCSNPLREFDGQPTLVLHEKAERKFGWTTDSEWAGRLNDALERANQRRPLRGEHGALAMVARWMRVFHGVKVMLPVAAGEHGNTWVYLGDGEHWSDPGGWDSGWVGWLFATPEQLKTWGWEKPEELSEKDLTELLKASFSEFQAWVAGDCYGYRAFDPDGDELDSCWGFYGDETYAERIETDMKLTQRPIVGWTVTTGLASGDAELTAVEDTDDPDRWVVQDQHGGIGQWYRGMKLTLVHPGHMREQFMDAIEGDRERRRERAERLERQRVENLAKLDAMGEVPGPAHNALEMTRRHGVIAHLLAGEHVKPATDFAVGQCYLYYGDGQYKFAEDGVSAQITSPAEYLRVEKHWGLVRWVDVDKHDTVTSTTLMHSSGIVGGVAVQLYTRAQPVLELEREMTKVIDEIEEMD